MVSYRICRVWHDPAINTIVRLFTCQSSIFEMQANGKSNSLGLQSSTLPPPRNQHAFTFFVVCMTNDEGSGKVLKSIKYLFVITRTKIMPLIYGTRTHTDPTSLFFYKGPCLTAARTHVQQHILEDFYFPPTCFHNHSGVTLLGRSKGKPKARSQYNCPKAPTARLTPNRTV